MSGMTQGDNPKHWLTIEEASVVQKIALADLKRLMRAFGYLDRLTSYANPADPKRLHVIAFEEACECADAFKAYGKFNMLGRDDCSIADRVSQTKEVLANLNDELYRRTGRRADPLKKLKADLEWLHVQFGDSVSAQHLESVYGSVIYDVPEYSEAEYEWFSQAMNPKNITSAERIRVIDAAISRCKVGRPKQSPTLDLFLHTAADDYRWLTGKAQLDWSKNPKPIGPFIDFLRLLYDAGGIAPTYRMLRAPKA